MKRCLFSLIGTALAFSQPGPTKPSDPSQPAASAAWDTLKKGLEDSDQQHRQKAVAALGMIGAEPEARRLAENALHDKNIQVRQQAAATLGEMGSPDAIPALEAALDDSSPEVSFTAAKALWSLGDTRARDFLWQVMEGERKDTPGFFNTALRNAKHRLRPSELAFMGAREAAGLLGPASIGVDALQEIVNDKKGNKSAAGRVVVAGILAKGSDPQNVALLEWALGDGSPQVRGAVAKALGECGNQASIAKLAPLLSDDRHEVRYLAAASVIRLNRKFPSSSSAQE